MGGRLVEFKRTSKKREKVKQAIKSLARSYNDFERVDYTSPPTDSRSPDTYWVKIKFLYQDEELIANQRYIIKYSAGGEHSGKTDDIGMAILTNLPVGPVEGSFPNEPEWY